MSPQELRKLIKEAVQDVLNEADYDHLTNDIPSGSELGEAWTKAIRGLTTLIDEVDGFNDRFATTMGKMGIKQKLAVDTYVAQLKQIMESLEQLHAPVRTLSQIQQQDNSMYEGHTHGRYAQQAGATPFQAPGDQAINETKTFQQLRDEHDPDGTKHDMTFECVKCGNRETCKCSKPKRLFKGICSECS